MRYICFLQVLLRLFKDFGGATGICDLYSGNNRSAYDSDHVLSRCQRYDFRRISIDTIAGRLQELMVKENISVEDKALRYVAKAADGSMRDALSLLDQCIAFYLGENLTYDKVLQVLGAVDNEIF